MIRAVTRSLTIAAALVALSLPAAAQTVTLTATLTGAGENPAINTGAFGSATVTVDVPTRTVTYRVDV